MESSEALPKAPRVPRAPEGLQRAPARPAPGGDAAGCHSPAAKPDPALPTEAIRLVHLNIFKTKRFSLLAFDTLDLVF